MASAKPAARHARAVNGGCGGNAVTKGNKGIHLSTGNFIVVTQGSMAAAHGYTGLIPIAAGKGIRKSVHARIFSNDVAGAAIAHIAKLFPEGFQQLQRSFPQGRARP